MRWFTNLWAREHVLPLCLFLVSCSGQCTPQEAAEAALPGALCSDHGEVCVVDNTWWVCTHTGSWTHTAKCRRIVQQPLPEAQ